MPTLSLPKYATFVRSEGAYLPGIGGSPTSKTDAPAGVGVVFEKCREEIALLD